MLYNTILAPIDGIVTTVDAAKGLIGVYVAPEDSHEIYSPIDGAIDRFETYHGRWIREMGSFRVHDQTRIGALLINFEPLTLSIEVGHGKYITDTVKIDAKEGEYLNVGQRIGHIVIGSYYELHFRGGQRVAIHITNGQHVIGSQTVMADIYRSL